MNHSPLIKIVEETISVHNLARSGDKSPVIVALSGGADSVALLAALTNLGYNCIASHCNFHLRGDESNRDEMHAREIAKRFECEILVKDFDVEKYCHENRESSIEVACRELRYKWFEELFETHEAQAIAVGHNSDDNCETVLFNLFRGCGIAGLHGISPKNDLNVIRPLINCSRVDIEAFLAEHGIPYITDSSNLTTDFSRNKIRNAILPEIQRWFSDAKNSINKTCNNVSEQERFYRQCISEKFKVYSDSTDNDSINLSKLVANESTSSLLLYEWYKEAGMTRTQADDIVKSKDNTGAKFESPNFIWAINKGRLHQFRNTSDTLNLSNNPSDYFIIADYPIKDFKPQKDKNIAYFDKSVLEGTPLFVRFLHPGDSIIPFGMKGRKKVSDIMNEANIPAVIRNKIPLLTKGDDILWIAGVRASSKYQITADSRRFVQINYTPESTTI